MKSIIEELNLETHNIYKYNVLNMIKTGIEMGSIEDDSLTLYLGDIYEYEPMVIMYKSLLDELSQEGIIGYYEIIEETKQPSFPPKKDVVQKFSEEDSLEKYISPQEQQDLGEFLYSNDDAGELYWNAKIDKKSINKLLFEQCLKILDKDRPSISFVNGKLLAHKRNCSEEIEVANFQENDRIHGACNYLYNESEKGQWVSWDQIAEYLAGLKKQNFPDYYTKRMISDIVRSINKHFKAKLGYNLIIIDGKQRFLP